jgi:hypothetical protein
MTYISILKSFGFKKVSWDKCPKGFQEANYPCYTHPTINAWAEVYPKEHYMMLQDEQIKGYLGKHFNEPSELKKHLTKYYSLNEAK